MLAGLGAGLALAVLAVALADGVAHIALALAHAAALLGAVAELGDADLRQRDRDVLAPLPADHLALRHILAQVFLDLAPHDLAEAVKVALGAFDGHRCLGGWELGVGSWGGVSCSNPQLPTPNS